jgi:WXG100 family type VII secretion target
MARAARLFEGASSEASGHLASVNREMAALQASWTGRASLLFGQAMNEWETNFETVIAKLNHMIEVMGGNATEYTRAAEDADAIAREWADGLEDL